MNFAIIDIETTGGSFIKDKITEIAIIKHDGEKIIDTFQSLVNPETSIPSYITKLTGIDNAMVSQAPKFYELAKQIVEFTEDCFFVAHNANFDYGFVRAEFKSLGFNYQKKTLCTVQMSRKLIPDLPSYSLGKLCVSLDIELKNHHRAMADTEATCKIFEILLQNPEIDRYIGKPKKQLVTYGNITEELMEKVNLFPEKIGVYFFKNNKGETIYIGKSINIKKRIFSHLYNSKTVKAIALKEEVCDLDYTVTNNELVALLLENDLVKKHQPKYNRALKTVSFSYGIVAYPNQNGYIKLDVVKIQKNTPSIMAFSSKMQALETLENLEKHYQLCQKINQNSDRIGACFNYSIRLCKGACKDEENALSYNLRVNEAIKVLGFGTQNFALAVQEHLVFVKNGKYAGFVEFTPDFKESFEAAVPKIDRDAHFILYAFLKQNSEDKYQRIEF